VVKELLGVETEYERAPQLGEYRNRQDLIRNVRAPEARRYDILRLCPTWPALTGGLARHLESTGAFIYSCYHTLRQFDPEVFVALTLPRMRSLFLKEQPVATVTSARPEPVSRLGLDVLPERNHPFFKLRPAEITRGHVTSAARELKTTVRAMMADYFRLDPDRARCLLDYWESDDDRLLYQFCMTIGFRLVCDLRIFLQGIGKLGERPVGWVDPFNLTEREAKRARQVEHLEVGEQQVAAKIAKAEKLIETGKRMIEEANEKKRRIALSKEAARGPVSVAMTETHPAMRAMGPPPDRIILEDRPKLKPSQRRRQKLKAKLARERLLRTVAVEETASELNSPTVMEVDTLPTPEARTEDRAEQSSENLSETRVVRILTSKDDGYWEEGLYSPVDGQEIDFGEDEVQIVDEEDVLILNVREEDRRGLK
jgi:hypothetical protein